MAFSTSHPLYFSHPQKIIAQLIAAGQKILTQQKFERLVLGVSGGVDSSFALYLATQITPLENIFVYLLPTGDQSTTAARKITHFYQIPAANTFLFNLEPTLAALTNQLTQIDPTLQSTHPQFLLRQGNLKARLRMITLFDQATAKNALVLGTENLSEKLLGYTTLHGDNASIIELFNHLYKTQVIQLASLVMPTEFAHRIPSAELWPNQTDEQELGFTYDQADRVLAANFISHLPENDRQALLQNIDQKTISQILSRVEQQKFKSEIPYTASNFGANWQINDISLLTNPKLSEK